jgi:rubredoxin
MAEHNSTYICGICGYVFAEAAGDADFEIAPGSDFTAFPPEWRCPECGCFKEEFSQVSDQ